MKRTAGCIAGALALLVPGLALGEPIRGLYLGGGAGLGMHEESSILDAGGATRDIGYSAGFAALGAVGYGMGGPRFELELGYRKNDGDDIPGVAGDATAKTASLLANFLYDVDLGSPWTPYLGFGLGVARAEQFGGSAKTVFAYQGILGVSYQMSNEVDFFADYRYFGTEATEATVGTRVSSVENRVHSAMLGVRWAFGGDRSAVAGERSLFDAPPPREEPAILPPRSPAPSYVPAPDSPSPMQPPQRMAQVGPAPTIGASAAAMARSYLVFFGFDKSDLTPEAQRIVRTAALNTQEAPVTRIDVTGHTDRAGPAAYNNRLSQRRATTVKRELMANGVPEKDIVIYAKGETDPLVPTADGVREPQNRRVEIVLK